MAKSTASKSSSIGCLILFGFPFAAVGVVMTALLLWNVHDYIAMKSWVETPAQILQLELISHRGDDSTTHTIAADYSYTFNGESYGNDRVAIATGSDNVGTFWQKLHRQLDQARDTNSAVCFVNPNQPEQAILNRSFRWEMLLFKGMFGVVFGGAGFGIMFGSLIYRRRQKRREERIALNPDQPWQADDRWASGIIRNEQKQGVWVMIAFTCFWNAISLPIAILAMPELMEKKEWVPIVLVSLFPLIGVGMAIGTCYLILQALKHGRITCEPTAMPIMQGTTLTATIRGTRALTLVEAATATLICGQQITTGSGKNRKTREEIKYRCGLTLSPDLFTHDIQGWGTAISLQIPTDVPPSNEDNNISWRLELRLPTTGIDGKANFPLPVTENLTGVSLPQQDITNQISATADESSIEQTYTQAGLERIITATSLRIISPPFRMRGSTIGMIAFGSIFAAIGGGVGIGIGLMSKETEWMPVIFGGIFALIGFSLMISGLKGFLMAYQLDIDTHGIAMQSGMMLARNIQRFTPTDIAQVQAKESYKSNEVSRQFIQLITADNRKIRLTPIVGDGMQATIIVTDIERHLKLNR